MTFNMENIPSIADIKAQIEKTEKQTYKSTVDKSFFPFWNMEEGEQAVVRFLPDADYSNPNGYFVESSHHILNIDGEDRRVTCPKTFGNAEDCPICNLSQKYYRDNDADKGKYYYRKRQSFVRVLVIKSPLNIKDEEGETVDFEGRVCTTTIGKQIKKALVESLADIKEADVNNPICAFEFTIKKRQMAGDKGKTYMSYAFSRITSGPSDIPAEYADNVELIHLSDLLPERAPIEKVQNYLDAHLGAAEFEYGPRRANTESKTEAAPAAKPSPAAKEEPVKEEASTPAPEVEEKEATTVPDTDVIAGILNRNKG